jgi:hypothetical protein
LNLNSAVYDFRLPGIFDVPFSCFTVYFTRYGTEQYALVLDTRLLTQEQFTYLRNMAAGYDERKQQQGMKEKVAIVIESEVTNG